MASIVVAVTSPFLVESDLGQVVNISPVEVVPDEMVTIDDYAIVSKSSEGCGTESVSDCGHPEIFIEDQVMRFGEVTTLSWDPAEFSNCILMGDLINAGAVSEKGVEDVSPAIDAAYVIACDNGNFSDQTTVRVLPRWQEN